MAAHVAAAAGCRVRIFEKRPSAGRKLLIAGSSGLNITHDAPVEHFYTPVDRMRAHLEAFPPSAWIHFVEDLGIHTFRGTSRRWFIEGMKAPPLLQAWLEALTARGVEIAYGMECVGFDAGVVLRFAGGETFACDAAALCLGGGSWEKPAVQWPDIFQAHGIACTPLRPSNIGFRVAWPTAFLAEAEGKPIKNVVLRSSKGQRAGDLMVTAYGLEGTPIYFVGEIGTVHVDLKPDLTHAQVLERLRSPRENLSPMRRVKRTLKLGEGALALLYHLSPLDAMRDLDRFAAWIKALPLALLGTQPLEEAISSAGGVAWSELDDDLMLRRCPGVFVAGEMIDWDAPTGGFLIQGCVSQGHAVGEAMARFVEGAQRI